MADKEEKTELKYDVKQDWGDYIIEEGGNTSLNLRMISWNDRPYKLDLRKYAFKDGQERPMRGVTLTDAGANELTQVLVSKGYGDTYELLKSVRSRDDYSDEMLKSSYKPTSSKTDEEYHDPKELLASSSDEND